jgi:hypothetical protein
VAVDSAVVEPAETKHCFNIVYGTTPALGVSSLPAPGLSKPPGGPDGVTDATEIKDGSYRRPRKPLRELSTACSLSGCCGECFIRGCTDFEGGLLSAIGIQLWRAPASVVFESAFL